MSQLNADFLTVDPIEKYYQLIKPMLENNVLKNSALERLCADLMDLVLQNEFDVALQIEEKLWSDFLPKNETEDNYNQIYSCINNAYNALEVDLVEQTKLNAVKKIVCVIHTPYYLAHVNCLYQLLKNRYNCAEYDVDIELVVLGGSNPTFDFAWRQLGVECISIDGSTMSERLKNLAIKINGQDDCIALWMCAPLGLPYFSQLCRRIVWWSVKMHPAMPKVPVKIGWNLATEYKYNEEQWWGFDNPLYFYNSTRSSIPYEIRDNKIGAFCREALLDNPDYWTSVKVILDNMPMIKFCYAGRKPIHEKWRDVLGSESNFSRVTFLGWLDQPEVEMRNYKAILDPFPLGHGLMAGEAVFADVPIIFAKRKEALHSPFLKRVEMYENQGNNLNKSALCGYQSDNDLLDVLQRLNDDPDFVLENTSEAKKIYQVNEQGWRDFMVLVNKIVNLGEFV